MYDFTGIGNACLDVIASVDEQFLERFQLEKSIQSCIDKEVKLKLLAHLNDNVTYQLGGSASNVSAVISALDGKSAFMGRLANDSTGKKVIDGLCKEGVHYPAGKMIDSDLDSTEIFSFTTPDTERTFASYYGIGNEVGLDDIDFPTLEASRIIYLDGYSLYSPNAYSAFLEVFKHFEDSDKNIIFHCADVSVIRNFKDQVRTLIDKSQITIFNEQEALALYGDTSAETIANNLAKTKTAGAVTLNKNGAYIFKDNSLSKIKASLPKSTPVDTCGAGDHFSGGFLYGLTHNYSLDECGRLASLCAADAITHFGGRPQGKLMHLLDEIK